MRPKPTAVGTLILEGADVTGQFPTKFICDKKSHKLMYSDNDWCNIYHVCTGSQDNIFICPPGVMFSQDKKGCIERFTVQTCSGTYYKPQKFNKIPTIESINNNYNRNNLNNFNGQLNNKNMNYNNVYTNLNSKTNPNVDSMANSFEIYYWP